MSEPLNATGIFPGITASDLPKSIEFYVGGLGFEIIDKVEAEGVVRFVMLKAGNAMMGVGMDDFAKGRDRKKGIGTRIYISTAQDIPALADRVRAAGFTIDGEVAPLSWGPMGFALLDPDGIQLTISNDS
ncbi:MAG: VOC family protein [Gemmatimonadales bacterium]